MAKHPSDIDFPEIDPAALAAWEAANPDNPFLQEVRSEKTADTFLFVSSFETVPMDSRVSLDMLASEAADLQFWLIEVIDSARREAKNAPEGTSQKAIAEKRAADAKAFRERIRALLFIPTGQSEP